MVLQGYYSLIIALIIPVFKSEIFTLRSGNNIICVLTGNSSYSAVYTQPYDFHSWSFRRIDKIELNLTEDWNLASTDNFSFYPVTDYRWQYFPFLSSVEIGKNAQSFSIYTNKGIPSAFSSFQKIKSLYNFSNTPSEYQWIHYTVVPKSRDLYLILENSTTMNRIKPMKKIINKEVMSKYHNYSFFYSSETNVETPSNYSVTLENNKCISMFVSVDKNCFLDIILKSKDQVSQKTVKGFNEKNSLKQWIHKEIKLNASGNATLQFVRRCQNGQRKGFWAIDDIRNCDNFGIINSSFVLANNSKNSPYVCNELKLKNNNKIDYNFWSQEHSVQLNFNCSEILGKIYCENYTVCYRHNCNCNWSSDYKNLSCPKICPKGYWGSDCNLKCLSNCEICDNDKNCSQCIAGYTLLQNLQNLESYCLKNKGNESSKDDELTKNILLDESSPKETTSTIIILLGFIFILIIVIMVLIILQVQKIKKYFTKTITSEEIPLKDIIDEKACTVIRKSNFLDELKTKIVNKDIEKEFFACLVATDKKRRENVRSENYDNKNGTKQEYYLFLPYERKKYFHNAIEVVDTEDYITASYIDSCYQLKAYVACESPKHNTVQDFWKMIWYKKIEIIIMAPNFMTKEKKMSVQFWPKEVNSFVQHGFITIQCIKNNDLFEYYNIQTLKVFFKNKEREIKHVHLKWDLDLEWTFYPNHLLSFVKEIRNCCKEFLHPILFYSDFGINGTGTLILTDMALHMIEEENCVDFLKLTKFLKYQRHNIINTEQQYVLSHLIVSEYLLQETNIFEINSEAFTNEKTITYYPEDLKKQLPYFQKLWEFDTVFQSWLQSQQTLENCSATSSYTYG